MKRPEVSSDPHTEPDSGGEHVGRATQGPWVDTLFAGKLSKPKGATKETKLTAAQSLLCFLPGSLLLGPPLLRSVAAVPRAKASNGGFDRAAWYYELLRSADAPYGVLQQLLL
jgi:hypothetical protein